MTTGAFLRLCLFPVLKPSQAHVINLPERVNCWELNRNKSQTQVFIWHFLSPREKLCESFTFGICCVRRRRDF